MHDLRNVVRSKTKHIHLKHNHRNINMRRRVNNIKSESCRVPGNSMKLETDDHHGRWIGQKMMQQLGLMPSIQGVLHVAITQMRLPLKFQNGCNCFGPSLHLCCGSYKRRLWIPHTQVDLCRQDGFSLLSFLQSLLSIGGVLLSTPSLFILSPHDKSPSFAPSEAMAMQAPTVGKSEGPQARSPHPGVPMDK